MLTEVMRLVRQPRSQRRDVSNLREPGMVGELRVRGSPRAGKRWRHMDVSRARRELGWSARRGAGDARLELLDGRRCDDGVTTAGADGPLRSRGLLTSAGARPHGR